jgi:hypothetical protein
MKKGLTNREVRHFVQAKTPFQNRKGTIFGRWSTDDTFAVYSYGEHWPLFVYERTTDKWYENEDRYGVTTTRHRTHTHPRTSGERTPVAVSLAFIRRLAMEGWPAIARARVIYGEVL